MVDLIGKEIRRSSRRHGTGRLVSARVRPQGDMPPVGEVVTYRGADGRVLATATVIGHGAGPRGPEVSIEWETGVSDA